MAGFLFQTLFNGTLSPTQAGVVAVLQMVKEDGVKAAEVEGIRCLGNHMIQRSLWNASPKTALEGKLSLHFCIAAALVDVASHQVRVLCPRC